MELSAGIFIIMLGIGFFSVILSLRGGAFGTVFRLVSIIVFFAISMILFAGYDVTFSETSITGDSQTTVKKYLIGDGTDNMDTMSQPAGWLFLAIGIILSMLFLVDAFRGNI